MAESAAEAQAEADRLLDARSYREAAASYRRALALDPSLFDAWCRLGYALESSLEYGDSAKAYRRALFLRPDVAAVRVNLGTVLFGLGHVSDAVREFRQAENEGGEEVRALAMANIACIAPGDPALDNAGIMQVRRRWVSERIRGIRPRNPTWRPGAKLRIGYLSRFFGSKNWMKMFMGVINAHDRDRFEVHLISDGVLPSAEAGYRDHDDDRIWNIYDVSNADLATHVASAKLDVLIDLNGYSFLERMFFPACRAVPVQISWANMYATTGFAAVDCVVGDRWTSPPEEDQYCVERVLRVPHTYMAFDVFYPVPDVAPPPCLHNGTITFGSLTSAYKITDQVIAAWSRILLGVPGARMLVRNRALNHDSNRADLQERFARHGIAADRLMLEGGADHDVFLRTYDRIDIALDAFPYNGGTTTAEAIWQGVPLLTFNGDRWAARTSRSILMEAGLGDFVAEDEAGFVAKAIAMASAPEALAARRATQRVQVAASPVCDTAGLCRALEAIYRTEADAKG